MVFGSKRRKKKEQRVVTDAKSSDTSFTGNDPNDSSGSISTASSISGPVHYSQKYCKQNDNTTAMAMFARMSTAIADTLTEQEFGNEGNSKFYRPKAKYDSQVIHPVECKRDIFVQSVTPQKKGMRKAKKSSIYKVNVGPTSPYNMSHQGMHDCDSSIARRIAKVERKDGNGSTDRSIPERNEVEERSSRFDGPELESRKSESEETYDMSHLSYSSSEDEEEDKENAAGGRGGTINDSRPARPKVNTLSVDTGAREELLNINASQYRLAGSHPSVRPLHSRHNMRKSRGVGHMKSRSTARSTQFRPQNNLRIETGSGISSTPVESNLLHDAIRYSHMTNPRSAAMEVSPSSTVSSLTIPAELEYNPTPREIFHQQMKSAPMVAINEDDHVITTHDYISVEEGDYSEI